MLHRSFKPAKCKTALKLATSRIKLMRNKKENQLKQLKRELALLLESGQDQTARIRVEHVVREEKTIAAYDLINIYCELIVARLSIIESQKNCPIDLKEAVTSVIFAAPRCADISELQDVRKHLTAKYGKDFINAALELRPECGVSRMLAEKLSANAPDGQTKLKILSAIAEEHNVEWDPKSFGEKESKPYDDLLKGPNAFDDASKMHSEPIIGQAPRHPNVHAPQGREEKHAAPVNYKQNLHSPNSHNMAPSDFYDIQSAPSTAPHPPVRPSENDYGGTEIRHSHYRDGHTFSPGGKNWNMEFKDATAAAQAAAESAERASMAARAAAQLSMRQHSHESNMSNADGLRDDSLREKYSSSEKNVTDADYNSPQDRNRMPSMRTEQEDGHVHENHFTANEKFYNDDQISSERYSRTTTIDDKRPVNGFHEIDRYSRKSSFEEEAVEPQNSAFLSGTRVSKQSSAKNRNRFSESSSNDDVGDYIRSHSHQNSVFDDNKDPFDHGISRTETVKSGDIGTGGPIFDSYLSDDDIIKFDKHPQYDELESTFYPPSITREPSNNFEVNIDKRSSWENTSGLSEKPLFPTRISAELFSPPQFDESSPKAPSSTHRDDMVPATFDDSSGPSSENEDELEKSSFRGNSDAGTRSYKEKDLFRNSDDLSEDHGLKGSSFTEKNDLGSSRNQNLRFSFDDRENTKVTGQNKHREDDVYNSKSSDTMKKEVFDQSRFESDDELKFSTWTGGFRNKGYKTPPYRISPSGDSLSSKGATEDSPTYTQNAPAFSRMESSSLNSNVGPKTKESSNSRTRFKNSDLGMYYHEGELPQQNLQSKREGYVKKENSSLKTKIGNHDSGMDDFKEELPKPKLGNKQEIKEIYSKSKFSPPAGFVDRDKDDSEEDLPKQTVTSKVRAGSGFSQRTKAANAGSKTSSDPKAKRGSGTFMKKPVSVSENNVSEIRTNSEKHSGTRQEKQKPSAMEQQPSSESSFKKASHVHPKLPDYDSIAAHLQSLRQNRG